ncbi:hypothetical protein NESM_000261100 [Novymonas esmeraldas]|uniref:Uncharacterized protein n=1 Tax=Novymonas esmeraldas TaxID=1808958 RepID=A0AAW0FAY5_9TRYP
MSRPSITDAAVSEVSSGAPVPQTVAVSAVQGLPLAFCSGEAAVGVETAGPTLPSAERNSCADSMDGAKADWGALRKCSGTSAEKNANPEAEQEMHKGTVVKPLHSEEEEHASSIAARRGRSRGTPGPLFNPLLAARVRCVNLAMNVTFAAAAQASRVGCRCNGEGCERCGKKLQRLDRCKQRCEEDIQRHVDRHQKCVEHYLHRVEDIHKQAQGDK